MALSFNSVKVALDVALHANQVPNIVGLQGIGKSDLVREFCKEKGYFFSEITCSLIQEGDLSMPYINPNGNGVSYAINTVISELSERSKDYEYVVLFLDEFNRASSQAQSELMNLVLQRRVVNYSLPENARIILAMNPNSEMEGYGNTNYSVAFSDNAILGRVVCLDMVPSLVEWIDYANRVGSDGRTVIHKCVSAFLSSNRTLFTSKEIDGKINNTPRGWSRVSDLVYSYEDLGICDLSIIRNLVEGTLERSTAGLFIDYYKKNYSGLDLLSLAKKYLFSGENVDLSKMLDMDLNDLFNLMSDLIMQKVTSDGSIPGEVFVRYNKFIKSVPRELCYSFIETLQEKYIDLYDTIISDDTMVDYILMVTSKATVKKAGAFNGKL